MYFRLVRKLKDLLIVLGLVGIMSGLEIMVCEWEIKQYFALAFLESIWVKGFLGTYGKKVDFVINLWSWENYLEVVGNS